MLTEAQKAEISWLMESYAAGKPLPDDWLERDKKLSQEVGCDQLILDFMEAHPELRHESRRR